MPDVAAVVDVVVGDDVVDVVDADVDVVDEELEEDGLLEHAASASAPVERISRRIDHVRRAPGIRRVYGGLHKKWGFSPGCSRRTGGHPPPDTARGVPCGQAPRGGAGTGASS